MEQRFTLATTTEGEVFRSTPTDARWAALSASSSLREERVKSLSNSSSQRNIVISHQLFKTATRTLLNLLIKRRHFARAFISRDTLNAPHRKEHRSQTDEWFVMNDRAYPIIKRIQIKSAQEYSSGSNLVEHSPTLLSR